MKIYDRSLPDIFGLLPWPYKVVIAAGCLFLVFAIIYVPYSLMEKQGGDDQPAPIDIRNADDIAGKLDPSIASDGSQTAMIFTTIRVSDNGQTTEVRLAEASDNCARFTANPPIFQSKPDELIGPDGVTPVKSGNWRIETPTLVYDAGDKGREWKAYAYKYFWADDVPLARLYGFVVSSTAPSPKGPWSAEEWVFSARADAPPAPYGQMIQKRLNTLDPSLADVYFYARPSALAINDVMLMTLTAFVKGKDTADRVILLASVDHGKNWKYLGTPIRASDVAALAGGYTSLAGAGLIIEGDTVYLTVVPGNADAAANGTLLIPFADVLKAELRRTADTGVPLVLKHIPRVSIAPNKIGGGFATYNDACDAGVITSEFSGVTGRYELMNTRVHPSAK